MSRGSCRLSKIARSRLFRERLKLVRAISNSRSLTRDWWSYLTHWISNRMKTASTSTFSTLCKRLISFSAMKITTSPRSKKPTMQPKTRKPRKCCYSTCRTFRSLLLPLCRSRLRSLLQRVSSTRSCRCSSTSVWGRRRHTSKGLRSLRLPVILMRNWRPSDFVS